MNKSSHILNLISLFVAVAILTGCTDEKKENLDTRPLVRIGTVSNGVTFTESLNVQGMIRAKNTSAISARVPGTIDTTLVDEGQFVRKGEALFKIDQVNLANAVRAARDDLAMSKARLAQSDAAHVKAQLDIERMSRLVKDGAVTKDMFEKSEVAAKSHAAALNAAKATVTKAETGLAVAEKNLADSEVKAPFDGMIIRKFKNSGDFCGAGTKVFDLEDTSKYEVCISLNAAEYSRVQVGKTRLKINPPNSPCRQTLTVSYKSPAVNPMTRTFEIRAAVRKTDALAAGMLIDCEVIFSSRTAQAVPSSAVARRGGGDCVFKVVDGKIARVAVAAGLATDGHREILSPTFAATDEIVIDGMLLVNEDDEVRTKK